MRPSDELIKAIKLFEGVKLSAYLCPAGVWTIGVGHTRGVKQGMVITMQQAEALLRGDLLPISEWLNKQGVEFTQGQFDALCDFAFNLGIGALQNSTLWRKAVTKAPAEDIQKEFRKWVYATNAKTGKKEKLAGLVKRRNWEAQRWVES